MEIMIRVGAALDASVTTVFRTVADASKRANQVVIADAERAAKAMAKSYAAAQKQITDGFDDVSHLAKRSGELQIHEAQRATRARVRAELDGVRDVERSRTRSEERQTQSRQRAVDQFQRRSVAVMAQAARASLSFGARVAGDLIAGMGVETSAGSFASKNVGLQATSTSLSNSGYIRGDARNGSRVDPKLLQAEAFRVANATATDPNKVIEGLQAFTAKTGELSTAREVMGQLAVLSKATGTNFEDMVSAAGDVSNQLGDIPNKAEVIQRVMRQVAAEGKLGAVEISDLATQMAKVAASAGQIEGDAGKNIATLTAFAQEARQRGGAASASQAATSVQGLINTFKTPARIHAFEAATGKGVYNKQGLLRDPTELMIEALRAKGMDPEGFKKIFANVQGARAVEGFATLYRQQGGGDRGEAAVRSELERLTKATMDDSEITESFTRRMNDADSQVQLFNNSMQQTTGEIQSALMPALLALAPTVISLAQGFATFIGALTGYTRNVQDKDVTTVLDRATKDTNEGQSALDQAGRYYIDDKGKPRKYTGEVGTDIFDKNDANEKALNDQLTVVRQRMAKEREEGGKYGQAAQQDSDEQLQNDVRTGDPTTKRAAENALKEREQAKSLEDALERIHTVNRLLLEAVKDGIVVTKMPDNRPLPTPGAAPKPVNADPP